MRALLEQESKKWHETHAYWRSKGVDGFVVGYPAGKSPGALTFDYFCPYCNESMAENRGHLSKEDCKQYTLHYLIKHDINFIRNFISGIDGEGI